MLKKIKTKEIVELSFIAIVTIILCNNFLQMHFSSDTYVLYDLGYMAYPSKYFLLDGRIISALVCYMAGLLNLPIPVYIIGMDFIGMIFLSISIHILSKVLRKILQPQSILSEIMIILASYVLILNQFTLEYLLFPESAVMCFGMLFLIISVKLVYESPNHKYFKIFLCLLITGLSYQGELNIFPALVIMIYVVKQIKENKKIKLFLKEFFLEMIKLAMIMIFVLAITMIMIKMGKAYFHDTSDRMMKFINLRAVYLRGEIILEYMDELWNECMHMLPKHSNTIVIMITIILLVIIKAKKQTMINYICLLAVMIASCVLPMFIFNTGICGRVNIPLMMTSGVSLVILLATSQHSNTEWQKNIVTIFTILVFIINSIFIIQNLTEHIAANRVDENTGKTIKYLLKKYEQENNVTVTKFGYSYDFNPQQYAVGIRPMQSMTERKFACSWSILYAMNYYCERDFKLVYFRIPSQKEEQYKNQVDYTEFSEEQLIFDGDTVYLIVY